MRIIVEIDVLGDTGLAYMFRSCLIEDVDAQEIAEIINDLDSIKLLSVPDRDGDITFFPRSVLDRSIVRVREL